MSETLTERCYLYRFFDVDGRLLYVGIARDLGSRFLAHRRRSEWWADVATGTTETHPSRADAELAEAIAIHSEHPLHNVARPTEEKIGRLHDAASQSHDVTQLVAEVERLRALCGEQAMRLVKMRGNIESAREGYRRMRAAYLAADNESSYWARMYSRVVGPLVPPTVAAPVEVPSDWGEG